MPPVRGRPGIGTGAKKRDQIMERTSTKSPSLAASLAAILLAAAALTVVAVLNGFPLVYPDTRSYYVGGEAAVHKGLAILGELFAESVRPADQVLAETESRIENAIGVRSAFYSLFVYLLASVGSLWAVVVAQSLIFSYVIFAFVRAAVDTDRLRVFGVLMAGLVLLTGVPWFTGFVMADVFTGLTVLMIGMLAFFRDRMAPLETIVIGVLLCAAISFHATHVLIALGCFGFIILLQLFQRVPLRRMAATAAVLLAPIVLALSALLFVGVVGFGEVTLVPQRPPFLLARSIADGPAKQYLQVNCPELGSVLCPYVDRLPDEPGQFLWDEDGIFRSASPAVRDQIRAEETAIVFGAIREYPVWELTQIMRNWVTQLVRFDMVEFNYSLGATARITDDDYIRVESGSHAYVPYLLAISAVQYLVVGLSFIVLIRCRPLWTDRDMARLRNLAVVVAFALVLNAFLCGAISLPTPRFLARMIWLVPMLAGVALLDQYLVDVVELHPFGRPDLQPDVVRGLPVPQRVQRSDEVPPDEHRRRLTGMEFAEPECLLQYVSPVLLYGQVQVSVLLLDPAVDDPDRRVRFEQFDLFLDLRRVQSVVVVQQLDVLALRDLDPRVPRDVRPRVLLVGEIRHVVLPGYRFGVSLPGIVDDDDLDRRVRLRPHALDSRSERVVPVVRRNDDRNRPLSWHDRVPDCREYPVDHCGS